MRSDDESETPVPHLVSLSLENSPNQKECSASNSEKFECCLRDLERAVSIVLNGINGQFLVHDEF